MDLGDMLKMVGVLETGMDHAITVGEVLKIVGVLGGLVLFVGVCILVLALLNPFRSGH